MSSDELAVLITSGNDEFIPLLWDKIKKYAYMLSGKDYEQKQERYSNAGIELWDIKQTAYIAYTEAIKGYDNTKGAFTTYYTYQFKSAVQSLLRGNKALNNSTSLDEPRENQGGEEISLYEVIEDSSAQNDFRDFETNDHNIYISRTLADCIALLPQIQRLIIKGYYFDNKTLKELAVELAESTQSISRIKNKAINQLRSNPKIKALYNEYRSASRLRALTRFEYSPEYFEISREIEKIEKRQFLSYGKRQALLYLAEQKFLKSEENRIYKRLYDFD